MLNDKQMTTLRKIAVRLRELKPYVDRIGAEIDEERTLLPERLWRSEIDDEASQISGALDFAGGAIDDAISHIAEVTGEDKPPGISAAIRAASRQAPYLRRDRRAPSNGSARNP